MLKEIAIGDAFGAGYEYASIEEETFSAYKYAFHPIHKLEPGSYTDDTQMSCAVANYILQNGSSWDKKKFIYCVLDEFHKNPIKGYSRGFQTILEEVSSVSEFIKRVNPESDKNGAAMRAVPFCLFDDLETVKFLSKEQALVTHSGRGALAAQVVALTAWWFRMGNEPSTKLFDFLNKELKLHDESWEHFGIVKSPVDLGMITTKAAITCVLYSNNFHSVLIDSVKLGGDTDTTAAIALGICSVSKFHQNNIPDSLVRGLVGGPFGTDYLHRLDVSLESMIQGTANRP